MGRQSFIELKLVRSRLDSNKKSGLVKSHLIKWDEQERYLNKRLVDGES